VPSLAAGYVHDHNPHGVGQAAKTLGAGRPKKGEAIDRAVGIHQSKKVGDAVAEGEPLAYLLANDLGKAAVAADQLRAAYTFGATKPAPVPLIKAVLGPDAAVGATV
jgi:thymidine phosphorylase